MADTAFKLLLDGHDTVECCYYLQAPAGKGLDFERLGALREALRQGKSKDPRPITLGGVEFLLQRYGSSRGFPLVLSNADMSIECGEFNDPSFYVIYRSEALWRESAFALHERFLDWARSLGFVEYRPETLSRVDWTFDYYLPEIDFDEDSLVSLSAKDTKHRKDRQAQGFDFGVGDVRLRMYDKVAEIAEASLKVWFFDLWGRDTEVWRIEWQVRKELLRRFGIRTYADLQERQERQERQGDFLRYLAHEHDTLRIKTEDTNRSRWPLHPLWIDLQDIAFGRCRRNRGKTESPTASGRSCHGATYR
ncbi:MAG: hypothetical protein AAB150_14030 [Pseudomonadota bacterium]